MFRIRQPATILLLGFCGAGLAALALAYGMYSLSRPAEPEPIGPIHSLALFPDGQRIATANQDGTVLVWDLRDGHETMKLGKQHPAAVAVDVTRTGDRVAAAFDNWTQGEYGWILWEARGGRQLRRVLGHSKRVNDVAFTPDGERIVTASADRTARVWDVDSGNQLFRFSEHEGDVNAVAVSPDGRRAMSAAGDYWGGVMHDPKVRLWDLESGVLVRAFTGHEGMVTDVAFSPDGSHAASCGWDGTVRVWELESGEEKRQMKIQSPPPHDLNCLTYSPDVRFLVAGSGSFGSGSIHIWDAASSQEAETVSGIFSGVHSIAFSPGGDRFASAHGYHGLRPDGATDFLGERVATALDGVVRIWDWESRSELMQIGEQTNAASR